MLGVPAAAAVSGAAAAAPDDVQLLARVADTVRRRVAQVLPDSDVEARVVRRIREERAKLEEQVRRTDGGRALLCRLLGMS